MTQPESANSTQNPSHESRATRRAASPDRGSEFCPRQQEQQSHSATTLSHSVLCAGFFERRSDSTISLIGTAYWFAYFLVILPLLGLTEKPLPQPETIEADFDEHYPPKSAATPAE